MVGWRRWGCKTIQLQGEVLRAPLAHASAQRRPAHQHLRTPPPPSLGVGEVPGELAASPANGPVDVAADSRWEEVEQQVGGPRPPWKDVMFGDNMGCFCCSVADFTPPPTHTHTQQCTSPPHPFCPRQVHALVADGAGLQAISPTLYLTFWSLALYDLEVPTQR